MIVLGNQSFGKPELPLVDKENVLEEVVEKWLITSPISWKN